MTEQERKAAFFAAMRRAVQIGMLLPDPESFDVTDPIAVAEAKMVVAEMEKARVDLFALLDQRPQ
jgi:hypothetical protein